MAKGKKVPVRVVKCQCSTCEQIAFVEPGKPHVFCKGIRMSIIAMLPASFKDLTNPTRKGYWREWVAPVLQSASPTPEDQATVAAE